MMIGIDLGTTYSAVAIPESRSGEGFFTLPACPGYSLILDGFRRRITPSVVAEDEQGRIVVGYQAKQRAGMSPEPIMFAKRWMGEEKIFQLRAQGALTPLEVSSHILAHLKQLAESRLQEPVTEAVVTVPAYFTMKARQATQEAAALAGLRVAQIAQEPVAAAIMYCLNDPRDPLRVMTYDLGGGTFDISILEKRDGVISTASMLAFEGDRFLGGYNFDRKLADWLVAQLNARGFDLKLDTNDPRDRVVYAKLMVIAERVKIDLSRMETVQLAENNTGIVDRRSEPVTIEMEVTRAQFEEMIRADVESTIRLCHQARLDGQGRTIEIDSLHEIVMVGGSSRIPLVRARLREEFGREPQLVEPDLCVALGAAMIAGALPRTTGCLRLAPVLRETELTAIEVSGQVVPAPELVSVGGCAVSLSASDGSWQASRTTKDDGAFHFQNVTVAESATTDFTLTVTSPAGAEVARRQFSVLQTETPSDDGQVQLAPNVLSKPIAILWADGAEVIAEAGRPLPFFTNGIRAVTTDASGRIRAALLEGANPIGELLMTNIPNTLPVGSSVDVHVTIRADYAIEGKIVIPSLSRESPILIHLPARHHKSVRELADDLQLLEAKADEALSSAGANVLFGDARAQRLQERLRHCRAMLKEDEPERIQDCLDEIEMLIRDINQGWKPNPPRRVFDGAAAEARNLYQTALARKPEISRDRYEERIAAIGKEADRAFGAQNSAGWKESYDRMERLCGDLEELARAPAPGQGAATGPPPSPQDPARIKVQLSHEWNEFEKAAKKDTARYEAFRDEFQGMKAALDGVNAKAPDALSQLQDWYFTRLPDFKRRVEHWNPEGGALRREKSKGTN